MRLPPRVVLVAALGLALLGVAPPPERGAAMVSSDHALASEAGAEILERGGNAVDAAVATALAAGVVQPAGSGLGGGGFAVVHLPGAGDTVLDFREIAPAAAHRDMYRTPDGGVHETASRIGGLAVAIPGEPRGLATLLSEHGTMSLRQVAAPAIALARRGFPLGAHLHRALERTRYPQVRALFTVDGRPPQVGEVVRRRDLARTLERWAASGGEYLSTGRGGQAIADAVTEAGGVITTADLAAYAPTTREPIVGRYGDYTIVTMPSPSSGGIVLLQMLAVLSHFDLEALGHNSSDYVHLLAEVMKHAYADRAQFMGDADFVEVPVERLLSEERISEIARAVWPTRTFDASYYGEVVAPPEDAGTQHISVVDADGRAVSLTTTINTGFGSGVLVEDLGVVLNNEMNDFATAPGVPNAFGLVGADANAVAAGKRPLSSMTPTVVLDGDGEVVMAIGGSGGSFIITSVLQAFLNMVVFDLDPQEAVAAPRMHHQWIPEQLFLEPGFPDDVARSLEARGHAIRRIDGFSAVQVVRVTDDGLVGGADPRKGGWPKGVLGVR